MWSLPRHQLVWPVNRGYMRVVVAAPTKGESSLVFGLTQRKRGPDHAEGRKPGPKPESAQPSVAAGLVGAIDAGDVCRSDAEMLGLPGRIVIGIILRSYLDAQGLSVFELVFDHGQLTGFGQQTALLENALVRVASVQARLLGEDLADRRAVLAAAHQKALTEAKRTEAVLSALDRSQGYVRATLRTGLASDAGLLRAALAHDSALQRKWPAKLAFLLDHLAVEGESQLPVIVDEAVADLLCVPVALIGVLGNPASLGDRVLRLVTLAEGGMVDWAAGDGTDRVPALSSKIGEGSLPEARLACFDRVRRLLKGTEPLYADDPAREQQAFAEILSRLVSADAIRGGPAMAEALTIRFARRLDRGGASGLRLAVVGVSETLTQLMPRLRYLLALAETDMGARMAADIAEAVEAAFDNEKLAVAMVLGGTAGRLAADLGVANDLLRESPLPEMARLRLLEKLGSLFDQFAVSGRLLDELATQEPVPGRRALIIADLLESGLIKSEAARRPVMAYLADFARDAETSIPSLRRRRRSQNASASPASAPTLVAGGVPTVAAPTVGATTPAPLGQATIVPGGGRRPTDDVPTRPADRRPTALAGRPTAGHPSADPDATVAVATLAMGAAEFQAPAGLAGLGVQGSDGRCPNCFSTGENPRICAVCGYVEGEIRQAGPHLQPGSRLYDRYRIGRLLGQGGFGATYLGWDDRLEIRVAVKEYFPVSLVARVPGSSNLVPYTAEHGANFHAGIRKFLDEARLLARLRDIKEIVGVQDFFQENATAYLVMEFLEGKTLKQQLADALRMEYRKVLSTLFPIMRALHQVHDQGLIHRDVSPDNIYITTTGERKLLDFGAARQAVGEAINALTVILKPGYAPPEQYYSDGRQGPWTDVYGMAATIHCALVGRPPADVAKRFQDDRLPPFSSAQVKVPPALEEAIFRGLAMRIEDRPQSMKVFASLLSKAVG